MRDLILHIGRHKTGTTAIQHFLSDNRLALKERGYLVPESGKVNAGHHAFSRSIGPPGTAWNDTQDPRQLPAFRQLARELRDEDPQLVAIISSEAFQNCDPGTVRHAFRDYRPRVVVYLRSQLDYLASAYVQRVHATDYAGSIEEFYRDIYIHGSNYFSFLRAWKNHFPERLCVRRYGAGNIVADFAGSALGLEEEDFEIRQSVSNPSLNGRVAAFKRAFNQRDLSDKPSIDQIYFLLPQLNTHFPGEAFRIPTDVKAELVRRCQPSDEATAIAYFNDTVLFDYGCYTSGTEETLSDSEFEQMYEVLQALVEEKRAARVSPAAQAPARET